MMATKNITKKSFLLEESSHQKIKVYAAIRCITLPQAATELIEAGYEKLKTQAEKEGTL